MSMVETLLKEWFLLDIVNTMPSANELALVADKNKFSVSVPAMLLYKVKCYAAKCFMKPEEVMEYAKRVLLPMANEFPDRQVNLLRVNPVTELRDIALPINSIWQSAMTRLMPVIGDVNDISNVMATVIHGKVLIEDINRELKESVIDSALTSTKSLVSAEEWGVIDTFTPYLITAALSDNCEESNVLAVKALTHLYNVAKFDTQQAIDKNIHEKAKADKSLVYFGQNPARLIMPVYWRVWGTLPMSVDISETFWMSDVVTNLRKSGILP